MFFNFKFYLLYYINWSYAILFPNKMHSFQGSKALFVKDIFFDHFPAVDLKSPRVWMSNCEVMTQPETESDNMWVASFQSGVDDADGVGVGRH